MQPDTCAKVEEAVHEARQEADRSFQDALGYLTTLSDTLLVNGASPVDTHETFDFQPLLLALNALRAAKDLPIGVDVARGYQVCVHCRFSYFTGLLISSLF